MYYQFGKLKDGVILSICKIQISENKQSNKKAQFLINFSSQTFV
jgi:hypothetical protein